MKQEDIKAQLIENLEAQADDVDDQIIDLERRIESDKKAIERHKAKRQKLFAEIHELNG